MSCGLHFLKGDGRGGVEFRGCDVANDVDGADGDGEDEVEDAAALLFVAGGEGDEVVCGGVERGQCGVAVDEGRDAGWRPAWRWRCG